MQQLFELIGIPLEQKNNVVTTGKPAFYTTGLDEVKTMIQTSQFGRQFTPYLKIKLDGDKEKGKRFSLHHNSLLL
jgi:hypothetical protein